MRPSALLAVWVAAFAMSLHAGERRWREVLSPNFRVVTDAGESDGRRAAVEFEQIRIAFKQMLPRARVDAARPITILAPRNEKGLQELLPGFWEQKGGARPAGVYTRGPEKHYIAMRLDVAEDDHHVVHHEYVHALLDLNYGSLPLWLNEGLAEYYATLRIEKGRVYVGKPNAHQILLLRDRQMLPVAALLAADRGAPFSWQAGQAQVFYSQSWALVHYLMLGSQCQQSNTIGRYIERLSTEPDPVSAGRAVFGDLQKLSKDLHAYVRQQAFCNLRVTTNARIEDLQSTSRLLTDAEALALHGDFMVHTGRSSEARALLDRAQLIDPGLAGPYESLAQLAHREGRREEARALVAKAVQLDSGSFVAHLMHGLYASDDVETHAQAQAAFERAIQLNPEFAPAHAALATLLVARGRELERALGLARHAVELEPGSATNRVVLGRLLLAMDNAVDARVIGERLLHSAKDEGERTAASDLIRDARVREEVYKKACATGHQPSCDALKAVPRQ
jgi:tetratricopeptide (TPR) repeat protein